MPITQQQRQWLTHRTLKYGSSYSLPSGGGFYMYEEKNTIGEYVSIPSNKTIGHLLFVLIEIDDRYLGGYIRQFPNKYIYLDRHTIEERLPIETFFLYLICYIPMLIKNKLKK